MIEEITLSDDFFIGMGGRQKTFIHPLDPSKCVKIAYSGNIRDVEKELRYRRICADHHEKFPANYKIFRHSAN